MHRCNKKELASSLTLKTTLHLRTQLPEHIWLAPLQSPPNIQSLCLCTQKIYALYQPAHNLSCEEPLSTEEFLEQLQDLKFKHLGGDVLSFHLRLPSTSPLYLLIRSRKTKPLLLSLRSFQSASMTRSFQPLSPKRAPSLCANCPHARLSPFCLRTSLGANPPQLKQFAKKPHHSEAEAHFDANPTHQQSQKTYPHDLPGFSPRRAFLDVTRALNFFHLDTLAPRRTLSLLESGALGGKCSSHRSRFP